MLRIIDGIVGVAMHEIVETLGELEALGLVVVDVNDLGELRVAPTQAGLDAVRDKDEEEDMATSARACVVSNCPAMAVDGTETCQVHGQAQRFGLGKPAARCLKCQRIVEPTDWVKANASDDGTVEHVRCRHSRAQPVEASER